MTFRVNDQRSIRVGRTSRRHRFPKLYASTLSCNRTENTRCHTCRALLVERDGYLIQDYRITPEGTCPDCGAKIPGRWGRGFEGQVPAPGLRFATRMW